MNNRPRWGFGFALVGIAALTVACGGGGGSAVSSPQTSATTSGQAKLTIPNRTTSSSGRRAQFISASSVSVGIAVNSGAPTFADVSATSALCTATSGGRTCTVPLSAPPGNPTITFTLYDAANGGGNALGTSSVTQAVVAGTPFTVAVVVNGIIATVALSISPATLPAGTAGSATISATAKDADGNTIIAPGVYTTPIMLTNGDTSGATSISPATITAPGQTATLNYTGATSVGSSATVGAQLAGMASSAVMPTVIGFGAATPTPTPSPASTSSGVPSVSCGATLPIPGTYTTISSLGTFSGSTYTQTSNMSDWISLMYTVATPAPSPSFTPSPSPSPTVSPSPTPSPTATPVPQPIYIYFGTFQLQSGSSGCADVVTSQDGSALTIYNGTAAQGTSAYAVAFPNVSGNYTTTFVNSGTVSSMVINNLSASGATGTVGLSNGDTGTITLTARYSTTLDKLRKIPAAVQRH